MNILQSLRPDKAGPIFCFCARAGKWARPARGRAVEDGVSELADGSFVKPCRSLLAFPEDFKTLLSCYA